MFLDTFKDLQPDIAKPIVNGQNVGFKPFSIDVKHVIISGPEFMNVFAGPIPEGYFKARIESPGSNHVLNALLANAVI